MNTHSSTRHGLSLVEVLIAIGVMAIGILGTAALLPIGGAEIAEATRLERAASIGRAAYRDSLVRGTLRAENLVCPSGGWVDNNFNSLSGPVDKGNSVCIDPLFWATNWNPNEAPPYAGRNKWLAQFPVKVTEDANDIPRMTRATLPSFSTQAPYAGWMSPREADSLFRWRDDLVFHPFEEDRFTERALLPGRPRQFFERDENWVSNDHIDVLSAGSRQYTGDYSWMVTLTPAETEDPHPTANGSRQLYTASFVVFHKRDMVFPNRVRADREQPSERIVPAAFNSVRSRTLGGGTLMLRIPDTYNTTDPEQIDLPKLRANQWILVAGWTWAPVSPQSQEFLANGNTTYRRPVFKWYRVASVVDKPTYDPMGSTPGWLQSLNVVGPDWDTEVVSANPGTSAGLYAIILDGVVGVYEKTIKL